MTFPSCCVIDDIHRCKSTVLSDFGTGLGAVCSALHWLGSKGQRATLRIRAAAQDAKAGWAVWARETKGLFNWRHLDHMLLLADECMWLGHLLQAVRCVSVYFVVPWLDLVLPWAGKRHGQRGACASEGISSELSPFAYEYSGLPWQLACSPKRSKRQHSPRKMTEEFLGGERTVSSAKTVWFTVILGKDSTRLWPGAPSGTCVRASCSAAQHQPCASTAREAAGKDWPCRWGGHPGAVGPRPNLSGIASTQEARQRGHSMQGKTQTGQLGLPGCSACCPRFSAKYESWTVFLMWQMTVRLRLS